MSTVLPRWSLRRNDVPSASVSRKSSATFWRDGRIRSSSRNPAAIVYSCATKGEASMDEKDLRRLIDDVKTGRLSRRTFVQTMIGLGLTAPLASQMLASAGVAHAQTPKLTYKPTKRGGGGALK